MHTGSAQLSLMGGGGLPLGDCFPGETRDFMCPKSEQMLLYQLHTALLVSTLRMRWPKYWSFSFSIIPFKEEIVGCYFLMRIVSTLVMSKVEYKSN